MTAESIRSGTVDKKEKIYTVLYIIHIKNSSHCRLNIIRINADGYDGVSASSRNMSRKKE